VVPKEAKEAGLEYYNHGKDQFQTMTRRFGPSDVPKAARNKHVRKPGDDEFGLQPRLAQVKPRPNKKPAKRRAGNKSKSRRDGKRSSAKTSQPQPSDATLQQIRTNAGLFLRACDAEPWKPIPHSAKTKATMELVAKW
jgi:hypothetical protein